jgi:anti-sigma factor RsiW
MMGHLSSEQLAEFMAGLPVAQHVRQHIEDCPACRTELANFREALGEFRGAVRAWSQDQASAVATIPDGVQEPRSWAASHQLAWAVLIAAVCIIASFVLPRHAAETGPASDAVLLNQVDAQVSRTVPSSMEPLMKLVAQE